MKLHLILPARTFFIALLLLTTNWLFAQTAKPLVITGKVEHLNPDVFKKYNQVWLFKGVGKAKKVVDSAKVNADGTFTLKVKRSGDGLYQLDLLKWQTAYFWSDEDVDIAARGYDPSNAKTKNSGYVAVNSKSAATRLINTALYNQFLAEKEISLLTEESLAAFKHKTTDTAWITYLRKDGLIKVKGEHEVQRLKQLIAANDNNPGVVYLLATLPADKEGDFFERTLNKVMAKYPQLAEAKQLNKEYTEKKMLRNALKAGSQIPTIVYNDPNGKPIDIRSFEGKVTLIDFWASWCGPCRKAIPEMKALYAKYKDKGFEVLSVSVDTDNAAWRKAMSEEEMPWPQVLSPNKNKTLADFMIIGIPTLYLIDSKGKIIEKYTGFTSKIKTQLETLFKDKI